MTPPGALVASQVCVCWRQRAKKIFQRHVTAEPYGNGIILKVKSFDCPDLPYPQYIISLYHTVALIRTFELQHSQPPWCIEEDWQLCELLDNVQVIDYSEPGTEVSDRYYRILCLSGCSEMWNSPRTARIHVQHNHPRLVVQGSTSIQVYFLRTIIPSIKPYGAHVVILNIQMEYTEASPFAHEMDSRSPPGRSQQLAYTNASPLAYEMSSRTRSWKSMRLDVRIDDLKELVLVFHVEFSPAPAGEDSVVNYAHSLKAYLEDNFSHLEGCVVHMIGLEEMFSDKEEFKRVCRAFLKSITFTVNFLSHMEYRDRVGPNTYRLHCIP